MRDPYEVLGVSKNADKEEIRKAYKNLAKKYHPDVNPGDEEAARKMSEINEAYDRIRKGDVGPSYSPYSGYSNNNGGRPYPPGGNGQWNQQGPYTWYYVRREPPRQQRPINNRPVGCVGGCLRFVLFFWISILVISFLMSFLVRKGMANSSQYNENVDGGTSVSADGGDIQKAYINVLEGWELP